MVLNLSSEHFHHGHLPPLTERLEQILTSLPKRPSIKQERGTCRRNSRSALAARQTGGRANGPNGPNGAESPATQE